MSAQSSPMSAQTRFLGLFFGSKNRHQKWSSKSASRGANMVPQGDHMESKIAKNLQKVTPKAGTESALSQNTFLQPLKLLKI